MRRALIVAPVLAIAVAGLVTAAAGGEDAPPSFADLLRRAGLELADLRLGLGAGDWLGHPPAAAVPFLLPHVEPVARDPRKLIALGENLLHAADPGRPTSPGRPAPPVSPGSGSPGAHLTEAPASAASPLIRLYTAYALQPRLPGFRGLPVALGETPGSAGALTAALARFAEPVDPWAPVDHRRPLPGGEPPAPSATELALPAALRPPLARLLDALHHAGRGVERSWRGVPRAVLERAVRSREVPRLLASGAVAWPALETAAYAGGDADRAAASLLVLAALERAAGELASLAGELAPGFPGWRAETPWGRVVVAGAGSDRHDCAYDCLLIVDLGGDDRYAGTAGAAVYPPQPVAAVLDLGGADRYRAATGAGPDAGARSAPGGDDPSRAVVDSPAQGAGLGGVGALFDLGGDDDYRAGDAAQGFGLLGYGTLWDAGGRDRFQAAGGAQGAAVFGAGVLVGGAAAGAADDDVYEVLGEGQGFGGPGACGALVDLGGGDRYLAEPDPARALGRADPHSGGRVAANNAQGAGVGRRGDLGDGGLWAGGVGVLADLGGDDVYAAGNFSQGVGYLFGTGMLLDAGGDDRYRAVYFAHGSGAHFSLALAYDRAGNDRRLLEQEAAASLGYGWDFALSVLVDGGGDDLYVARDAVLGVADRSSVALVLELGGDDVYRLPGRPRALGRAGGDPRSRLDGPLRAAAEASALAFFLDLGGADVYPARLAEACRAAPANRTSWRCGRARRGARGARLGAGLDLDEALPVNLLSFLFARPTRTP